MSLKYEGWVSGLVRHTTVASNHHPDRAVDINPLFRNRNPKSSLHPVQMPFAACAFLDCFARAESAQALSDVPRLVALLTGKAVLLCELILDGWATAPRCFLLWHGHSCSQRAKVLSNTA